LDVLTSVSGCPGIARVLVVGDGGPELLRHFDTTASAAVVSAISAPTGLNVAVEHGESWARRRQHRRIAVIAADLPCLTAADLLPVLAAAATTTRGFVTDEGRAGTTILTTTGPGLRPEFGEHSARRHLATGAEPLPATAGARLDVDHLTALLHARDLGVGMATAAVLSRYRIEPSRSHDRGRLDRG
jgi:2-phospho-L-lactate guanylyltransferase